MRLRMLDGPALSALSSLRSLSLDRREMQAIRDEYRRRRRDPTDAELETLAQTWSEHCKHKTFKAAVAYRNQETGEGRRYANLMKETIMQATADLDRPWCLSVFKDNAGIVRWNARWALAFKVETHNHPSALDPFGGASTGIGGVIRDVLGAGLGAKPLCNTDVFCVGAPDTPRGAVPAGVLHPARILKGVVAGVRSYGNPMGIPTINGAVVTDPSYICNPLVFCGTLGILPTWALAKRVRPGDAVVVIGGRTGRDGIHGATFSSAELNQAIEASVVQIGNPIVEKKVLDVVLRARDARLYRAITDCGAGGLSSAIGEMGEEVGADVRLDRVPLKYAGLAPWEIWLSEAQERMVLAVPPANLRAFLALCREEGVEAAVLGRFGAGSRRSPQLIVRHGRRTQVRLSMAFLHGGLPGRRLEGRWTRPRHPEPPSRTAPDLGAWLLRLLGDPAVGSKEWIVRQYDHEVQARTVIKPLQGAGMEGPGDASVVQPFADDWGGVAVGNGLCPFYSQIDPYWMAACAIDEALRNVVCVGGDPSETAILDNFCWGRVEDPASVGQLVRALEGCRDAALAYGTPFVSGKDSLNNEYRTQTGRRVSVLPTLLISAMARVRDLRRCVTMDFKRPGGVILAIGRTKAELGGGLYYRLRGAVGNRVPRPDLSGGAARTLVAVAALIRRGWLRACHDCSEGGLLVALAESALAGGWGFRGSWEGVPAGPGSLRPDELAFSESATRFVVEVDPRKAAEVLRVLKKAGVAAGRVGVVTHRPWLTMEGAAEAGGVRVSLDRIRRAWKGAFQGW